ncbi:MAG: Flp pilus assembly protein CpaB [Candidatus Omnitrophica bacterium]|nr:Flp pilus assembly protein CpaB [Candidatus Omnitrophota bacterium]
MVNRRIALIISLLISLVVASIALLIMNAYIGQQKQQMAEQAKRAILEAQSNQAAVLVAKQDIPRGVEISPEMFDTAVVPRQFLQPQAISSLDRISGMITVAPISAGEQITLTKLTYSKQSLGGLAEVTPVGKRAITISVDEIASLARMVKPGDYVDVIAYIPLPVQTSKGEQVTQEAMIPILQNVLVLAVGQQLGTVAEADNQSRGQGPKIENISPLVTIALDPTEASILAFLQEQSKIRLVLRSPADSKIQPVKPISWDGVLQYLIPRLESYRNVPQKEEEAAPSQYIEIYRGLNKGRIPLSQEKQ